MAYMKPIDRSHQMTTRSAKRAKLCDISDQDFLSNLPDDILQPIIKTFNYDELDVICQVSRKMFYFALLAKQDIEKEDIKLIRIKQTNNGDFLLYMQKLYSLDLFFMTVKRTNTGAVETRKKRGLTSAMEREMNQGIDSSRLFNNLEDSVSKRTFIPSDIYGGIKYLVERFNCRRIYFESLLIDNTFLSTLAHSFENIDELCLEFLSPTVKSELAFTKRFLKWLVSQKAVRIALFGISIKRNGEVYDWFVRELADCSLTTDLHIGYEPEHTPDIAFPNGVPVDSISKFTQFQIPDLQVDEDSYVEIIKKRLRERRVGILRFSNRLRATDQVVAAFGDDFEVSIDRDGWLYNVRVKDARFSASSRNSSALFFCMS